MPNEGLADGNFVLNVLGRKRFISVTQAMVVWNSFVKERRTNHDISLGVPRNVAIPYFKSTIEKVASDESWHLVYNFGFSLRESLMILGIDSRKRGRICYHNNNNWWLHKKENSWAAKQSQPGYYLIKTKCLFRGRNWRDQELLISQMGKEFSRAPSQVVVETHVSYFMLNGKFPSLKKYYHLGGEKTSLKKLIYLDFLSRFITLGQWPSEACMKDLGVYIARKPDF